jgi:capsular polysaccharide biosynthesis protein
MPALPQSRFLRYLTVALRWILLLTVIFYATFSAANYLLGHMMPQVYTASASVRVPPSELEIPSVGTRTEVGTLQPEFENEIRSPDFLLSVIKDLGLDKTWAKRIYQLDGDTVPDVDSLTNMEKLLTFKVDSDENLIVITASSDLPEEAAEIANAVADRYQTMHELDKVTLPEDQVRVLTRAEAPAAPAAPNQTLSFYLTLAVAALASLMGASFIEIILLFQRAGQREGN